MAEQKKLLYRSGDGFYCENCGYLRGYPFNDSCLYNCQAEWYHIKSDKDEEYIRKREIQKQKLQKAQAQAQAQAEFEAEEYVPPLSVAAPLCMQLSIPHISEMTYDDKCYNDNLTSLLNSRILTSLNLYEDRILKNK